MYSESQKFIMRSISSAQQENILSLASHGYPTHQIVSRTGVGKSTIFRVFQEHLSNQDIPSAGHPSKLSPTDKTAILIQIMTGKLENAVQATNHINSIISDPVSEQTIRNLLKSNSFKAVTKKKKPLLTAAHR